VCHNIIVGLLLLRKGARVAPVVFAKKQTEIYTQGEPSLLVVGNYKIIGKVWVLGEGNKYCAA